MQSLDLSLAAVLLCDLKMFYTLTWTSRIQTHIDNTVTPF